MPERWRPEPAPSTLRITAEALVDVFVSPVEAIESSWPALTRPRQLMSSLVETARGAAETAKLVRSAGGRLNGPLGPHRSYAWARGSLSDVKEIRKSPGRHGQRRRPRFDHAEGSVTCW